MDPTVREERLGSLETIVVEASEDDADGTLDRAGPRLTVVLCHGFGAPATDLVDLAFAMPIPPGTRFVFPAAPLPVPQLGPEARAWWPVDIASLQAASGDLDAICSSDPPGMAGARDRLAQALAAARERWQIGERGLVLGGFSQGAILSADVAFRTALPLRGLLLWSGMLFVREAWRLGMQGRRGLPVVQSHGTVDPILPFLGAERLQRELVSAGLDVKWVVFPGGHGIGPGVLPASSDLLRSLVSTP
ncbi:MAG: phospholipase [Polyangiaceae bacterium]|nr:phospholipase [Polyangiaceae bacterium]